MHECASQFSEAAPGTLLNYNAGRKKKKKRSTAVKAAANPVEFAGIVEQINRKK